MNEPWVVLGEQTPFENKWVKVRTQRLRLPDGREYEYSLVDRPHQGVGIILFDDEGRLLIEREYRHGVGEVVWQFPGGLIDGDEDPLLSAQRELREETGYRASEWEQLTWFYDNPALGNAASLLFVARGAEREGEPMWDSAEQMTQEWVTVKWLREAIRRGDIVDRVVLAAVAQLWARGEL